MEKVRHIHVSEVAGDLVVQLDGGGAQVRIVPGMRADVAISKLRELADMLEFGLVDRSPPAPVKSGVAVCPWPDFKSNPICEGDTIRHPDGTEGKVIFLKDEIETGDQWRVDYGDGVLSRLCLQIGDKGQAVVVKK